MCVFFVCSTVGCLHFFLHSLQRHSYTHPQCAIALPYTNSTVRHAIRTVRSRLGVQYQRVDLFFYFHWHILYSLVVLIFAHFVISSSIKMCAEMSQKWNIWSHGNAFARYPLFFRSTSLLILYLFLASLSLSLSRYLVASFLSYSFLTWVFFWIFYSLTIRECNFCAHFKVTIKAHDQIYFACLSSLINIRIQIGNSMLFFFGCSSVCIFLPTKISTQNTCKYPL